MAQPNSTKMEARSPSTGAVSTSSAGTKRKRDDGPKFYAVRVGKRPGIYYSWDDAKEQLNGVKGHLCMKFSNLKEAEDFVATGFSRTIKKYYGVRNGRNPGVYTHWPDVQAQITGWTKPSQRAFSTRAEAQAFVNGVDNPTASSTTGAANQEDGKGPSKKQQKLISAARIDENIAPGEGPMPLIEEDTFDVKIVLDARGGKLRYKTERELNAAKMQAVGPSDGTMLRIYTDGSALGNGKDGATAGVGVYFGPQDARNVSEGLTGARQTNQRAELSAIQRAVDLAPRDRDITICSDSNYAINCVTEWFQRWRMNSWKTANGKPVENRDIIEPIVNKIEQRQRLRVRTQFEWIKGHANDAGNVAADRLAVAGAEEARRHGG